VKTIGSIERIDDKNKLFRGDVKMKIKVSGSLRLRGNFEVELHLTEEEFDALSEREQNEEIEGVIDWRNWTGNAELYDLDVDDVEKL
jgi:hypothetical protein